MMLGTYDIEAITFQTLKANQTLVSELSGGIYLGQRPLNSDKEDLVISTISMTQEFKPQLATSNINVHVPDMDVSINGVAQKVENRERLKSLSSLVLKIIREAEIDGLIMVIESQKTLRNEAVGEHYVNIRTNWIIH